MSRFATREQRDNAGLHYLGAHTETPAPDGGWRGRLLTTRKGGSGVSDTRHTMPVNPVASCRKSYLGETAVGVKRKSHESVDRGVHPARGVP